jgi:hypothetical protein
LGSNRKFVTIIGAVALVAVGLLVFLSIWDPPAPSQEIQKDVTDQLFAS